MKIETECQHCHKARFIMDCKRHSQPYTANVVCDLCGLESAFIISFLEKHAPNGKPQIMESVALEKDQYLCPECLNVYGKGRSDEEALEQARRRLNDPDLDLSETELICEDCYREIVIPQLN